MCILQELNDKTSFTPVVINGEERNIVLFKHKWNCHIPRFLKHRASWKLQTLTE